MPKIILWTLPVQELSAICLLYTSLYDWHEKDDSHRWHGFSHAHTALLNASTRFSLTDKEKDIIAHHMWPLNLTKVPRSREALLVCLVDKYCSTVETLTKRSAQA